MAVHRTELPQTLPIILDDHADTPVHIIASQHLQHHILCTDPVGKLALQLYTQYTWHLEIEWLTGDSKCHIETSRAKCKHAHTAQIGRASCRERVDARGGTAASRI